MPLSEPAVVWYFALSNARRALHCCLTGTPLDLDRIVPLSEPVEVWYFDLGSPPSRSDTKTVDLEFTRWGFFLFLFQLGCTVVCSVDSAPALRGSALLPLPRCS